MKKFKKGDVVWVTSGPHREGLERRAVVRCYAGKAACFLYFEEADQFATYHEYCLTKENPLQWLAAQAE